MQPQINKDGQEVTITLTQYQLKKIDEALQLTTVKDLTKLISVIVENELIHKPHERAHRTISSLQNDLSPRYRQSATI